MTLLVLRFRILSSPGHTLSGGIPAMYKDELLDELKEIQEKYEKEVIKENENHEHE